MQGQSMCKPEDCEPPAEKADPTTGTTDVNQTGALSKGKPPTAGVGSGLANALIDAGKGVYNQSAGSAMTGLSGGAQGTTSFSAAAKYNLNHTTVLPTAHSGHGGSTPAVGTQDQMEEDLLIQSLYDVAVSRAADPANSRYREVIMKTFERVAADIRKDSANKYGEIGRASCRERV